jgi:hypothetical protein
MGQVFGLARVSKSRLRLGVAHPHQAMGAGTCVVYQSAICPPFMKQT